MSAAPCSPAAEQREAQAHKRMAEDIGAPLDLRPSRTELVIMGAGVIGILGAVLWLTYYVVSAI